MRDLTSKCYEASILLPVILVLIRFIDTDSPVRQMQLFCEQRWMTLQLIWNETFCATSIFSNIIIFHQPHTVRGFSESKSSFKSFFVGKINPETQHSVSAAMSRQYYIRVYMCCIETKSNCQFNNSLTSWRCDFFLCFFFCCTLSVTATWHLWTTDQNSKILLILKTFPKVRICTFLPLDRQFNVSPASQSAKFLPLTFTVSLILLSCHEAEFKQILCDLALLNFL